ncbi:hypothetical protein HYFRA_00009741 [Hymenoscyphus fraxineus]|uniref:C2H2-type domain-containing protein n=1 Tax=Hymenoscyphus fraxineus TaxID=746836 RepID=A0A9N9KRL8_9HELO|nr:hypothetical protein HYFRA_00009741 [Hymenoscyphus fraxineus]
MVVIQVSQGNPDFNNMASASIRRRIPCQDRGCDRTFTLRPNMLRHHREVHGGIRRGKDQKFRLFLRNSVVRRDPASVFYRTSSLAPDPLLIDEVQGNNCLINFRGLNFTSDRPQSLVRERQCLFEALSTYPSPYWTPTQCHYCGRIVVGYSQLEMGTEDLMVAETFRHALEGCDSFLWPMMSTSSDTYTNASFDQFPYHASPKPPSSYLMYFEVEGRQVPPHIAECTVTSPCKPRSDVPDVWKVRDSDVHFTEDIDARGVKKRLRLLVMAV